jgi:transcriptional antiterminator RfaH
VPIVVERDHLDHPSESMCWYAVRTKPKQETRAELNLHARGIEVLAPKVREPHSHRKSTALSYAITPLFPGYLFARFAAAALLAKVRLTRGVQGVVGFGEYATAVDDAIVELIRGRIQQDGFVRIEEPRPGEMVTVVAGPLRTLTGVFERRRGHDRAVILLGILGAQMHAEIPIAAVRRASAVA